MTSSAQPRELRRLVLEESKRAHVGHIGSSLSIADIMDVLWGDVMRAPGTDDPDRDVFVLSKGHAALILYCCLYRAGLIDRETLGAYCADDSLTGVHPDHRMPGVEFTTGSLGQGLSMAAGSALGARLRHSSSHVYAVLSDAEMDEGSVWEAVMFAAHHRLDNLTIVIDNNGQQALGRTDDVVNLGNLVDKFTAFGWDAAAADGHNRDSLLSALRKPRTGKPRAIVAETVAGHGVSYMEGKIEWHYLPMTDEQYEQALKEVDGDRA